MAGGRVGTLVTSLAGLLFEPIPVVSPGWSPGARRAPYEGATGDTTDDTVDSVAGTAWYNAFAPAISTGMFHVVDPGTSVNETVSIDSAE